ncbi:AlpA family phage regulatory protein [Pseudoalteromonas sp. H105]|uniref:AlpA family phage regulatory protein n=1 Tax=Pseudoalteromonas sp. H105 TaxID=1348393 RepID=UPI000A7F2CC7|nr:AlpA family phage regulatory protein [Pseudoalteromonas sp. H105]
MRLIKLKEVIEKTSLGYSSVYKFISEGIFQSKYSLVLNQWCRLSQRWVLGLGLESLIESKR